MIHRFGEFALDVGLRELRRGGEVVALQPKSFAVLLYLVENAHRAVASQELLDVLWADVHVHEAALRQAVRQVRRALDRDGADAIRTVRGYGYRFAMPVSYEAPALPASASLPRILRGEHPWPFVGRAAELARLEELAASVEAGSSGIAVLTGEPGIGKTRLAAELARAWAGRGGNVLGGQCMDAVGGAYEPFVLALADRVQAGDAEALRGQLGELPQELARLVPQIDPLLGPLPERIRSEAETERLWLYEAVLSWLSSSAAERPTLLVLDDLQWAGATTLSLLEHLAAGGLPAGLLLLLVHRPVAPDAPLAQSVVRCGRETTQLCLALEGLTEHAMQHLLAGRNTEPGGAQLHAWTGGNPFFLLEVLRSGTPERVPRRVLDVVQERVAGLGREVQAVLAAAAVLGSSFDAARAAAVAGIEEAASRRALDAAKRASLTRAEDDTGAREVFTHDIVRDALLAGLSPRRQSVLHRRALDAIERAGGPRDAAEVAAAALHAVGAGEADRALLTHRALGEARLRALAASEAVDAFETALAWLGKSTHAADRGLECDLRLGLAVAQGRCGVPEHWETAQRAAELGQQLGDPVRVARAALALARPGSGGFGGWHPWRVEALRMADAGLPPEGELALRVRAALLGEIRREELEPEQAQAMGAALERHAEALGQPRLLAEALAVRFYTHAELADRAFRLELANRMAQASRRSGDPSLVSLSATLQARALFAAAHTAEADVVIDSCIRLADRAHRPHARAMARYMVANRLRTRGRFAQAAALADEARAIEQAGAVRDADLKSGIAELSLHYETNRLEGVAEAVRAFLAAQPGVRELRAALAMVLAEAGHREAAARELDLLLCDGSRPPESALDSELTLVTLAARAAARADHEPAAHRLLPQLEPHPDAYAFTAFTFSGWVGHHVGALLVTLGRPDEAVPHLERALARYRQDDMPLWEARACRDLARALTARGDAADAERAAELGRGADQHWARFDLRPPA